MSRHIDRRVFVKAGGLALVSLGLDPIFLTRAAFATDRGHGPADRRKTLVCVFQRGAVDGLSMVVPHGDAHYYAERARIAIPAPGKTDGALDLDGYFGFHPALKPLIPLYRDGSLAVVHAVGSPNTTRSHFDAQDYMESGTPGRKATTDGWLNRHLAHQHDHTETPFRGIAMGQQLPRALRGSVPTLAIDDLRTFGFRGPPAARERLNSAFEALYAGSSTGIMASSSAEAFEAIRLLKAAHLERYEPANGAAYPQGRFGQAMRQIAQMIKSDLGLEIAFTDIGGWDTHANQGSSSGQLALRLTEFARGLSAFANDLGPRLADVVVLTMSEFGLTVAENDNSGTDHGHATAMFVLGGGTQGGSVLGSWPTLDPDKRFEGRDLAVTTDFRDLFGEVLVRHLGTSKLSSIFPGHRPDMSKWVGVMGV